MAATEYCRLTPEGIVTPCPYMDVVAGNVRESSFTDVWNTSGVFRDLTMPQQELIQTFWEGVMFYVGDNRFVAPP